MRTTDPRKPTAAIVAIIAAILMARGIWAGETTWMVLAVLLVGIIPILLKSR